MTNHYPQVLTRQQVDDFILKLRSHSVTIEDRERLLDALSTTRAHHDLLCMQPHSEVNTYKYKDVIRYLFRSLLNYFSEGDPMKNLIRDLVSEEEFAEFSTFVFDRARLLLAFIT